MALERINTLPTPKGLSLVNPQPVQEICLPPHVENLLALIQTHFERARDARPWDLHDERSYGKLVICLSGPQCRELADRLRARYHWRPSVAQVRVVLDEMLEDLKPQEHEARAATVVRMPKALPSTGEGPGRDKMRQVMGKLRGTLTEKELDLAQGGSLSSLEGEDRPEIFDVEEIRRRERRRAELKRQAEILLARERT